MAKAIGPVNSAICQIVGPKAKQPYAIAMKDVAPFGIAGIWENWKEPLSGEWIRTFAIITTNSNEMVADIHDCMPVNSRAVNKPENDDPSIIQPIEVATDAA